MISPKRQYRRKKIKPKLELRSPSTSATSIPSTSTTSTPAVNASSSGNSSKPRKGMKTVKQRLGKILKIHKMIH
ncbi:hypothetical protein NQ314_014286 [Rhamnusium bicolor]|uniref:Uncharacterized protein n=1 Tax=Rhamnusium bicolor TaxID=1586634 RepID=A0AAV8X3G2_9CUCU|nr:hypothetical protein NQ314_014286 [Rhamnusium bicolor]